MLSLFCNSRLCKTASYWQQTNHEIKSSMTSNCCVLCLIDKKEKKTFVLSSKNGCNTKLVKGGLLSWGILSEGQTTDSFCSIKPQCKTGCQRVSWQNRLLSISLTKRLLIEWRARLWWHISGARNGDVDKSGLVPTWSNWWCSSWPPEDIGKLFV